MQELTNNEVHMVFGGCGDDNGPILTGGTPGPYDPLPQQLPGLPQVPCT